jgi:acyl carrier protein
MPPIAGVIHAAMVLDDGILANLDAERFHRVLAPKVAGAENLDRLVRGEHLDYFVLFSSVTSLIGNPGQANYVAANAYMEGLARRRRQEGLPALAIGWGPILDVGVVAQNERLQSGLQKLTGISGMRVRDALGLMAQALEQPTGIPDTAVMTISPNEGMFSSERLAVLRSPTYQAFISGAHRVGNANAESIDLQAIASKEGVDAARRKVADVIGLQLAHVLHMRAEDISQVRPLGEIGLDSLMALELLMNLEALFGISIPLSGSSGGKTIADIADQIISYIGLDRDSDDAAVAVIAAQHHREVDPAQLDALKGLLVEQVGAPKRLLS